MSFFSELKRRNVLRAGALYIGAAWALSQGVAQLLPVFDFPNWVVRWFVIAVIIGFPFAMLFSWFYEWTAQGIQRESEVEQDESITRQTGKKMDRWIIAVMAVAIVLLLTDKFVLHKDATTSDVAAVQASGKSIAVLPLANESGDKDQQYFSDGLSEDLITALSQFDGLKVISRNSSFQFRDTKDDAATIGKKLTVAHLLEGSVRRAGDEVRISAELVNVADGTTLWSQHYDRPYKDLFKLQDDITGAVAGELKTKLLPAAGAVAQSDRPPSGNLAAWDAFQQGQFQFGRDTDTDYRKAIDSYQIAIKLDPNYALAYAALAGAQTFLADSMSGMQAQQTFAMARDAANTASTLNPNLAAAHAARALLLLFIDIDVVGTEAEFRRALELKPNDPDLVASLAQTRAALGHPEAAIEPIRQAIAADPRSANWYSLLESDLMAVGRLDEAEQAVRKEFELQPAKTCIKARLSTIEVLRGHAALGIDLAMQTPSGKCHDLALANALQIGNDVAAADAALKTVIDRYAGTDAYFIARTFALRKDPEQMFAWLDRAWANHDNNISILLYDPFLMRYKNDPRFAKFCKKVGLPVPGEMAASNTAADQAASGSTTLTKGKR
jgi:TolB-like protein